MTSVETIMKTRDGAKAVAELKDIADKRLARDELRQLVWPFLNHELFLTAYGGKTRHHAYIGGLAVHTLEVTQMVGEWTGWNQLVVVAAMLHDFGKVYAYRLPKNKEETGLQDTDMEKMVRHVVYSWHLFMEAAEKVKLNAKDKMQISHCMLAHHGRREWGSPIAPLTELAHLLATADFISMQRAGEEHKK